MLLSRRFQRRLNFTTLRFLNRQIVYPDPKIGIAKTGSFRNDLEGQDFSIAKKASFRNDYVRRLILLKLKDASQLLCLYSYQ